MSFDYDGTGIVVEDKQTYKLMPKGNYDYEIVEFVSKSGDEYPKEGKTKNGDPKVDFLAEVITPGEWQGARVFHSVAFLPKEKEGAGMAIHFLKTINQPWEGKFTVDPQAWIGERFRGYTVEDEYNGRKSNKIKGIEKITLPTENGLPF